MIFPIKNNILREKTQIKMYEKIHFKDIINNNIQNFEMRLVCPFFQLGYDETKEVLYTLPECKKCGICELVYTNKNDLEFTNFDSLLSEPKYLAFLLDKLLPNKKHYAFVSIEGHSRNMRIDLVQKSNNSYTLINILNDEKKDSSKYNRAYKMLAEKLKIKYKELNFQVKTLGLKNDNYRNIITIEDLLKENENGSYSKP
ncbi:MAG TPA: hypothetical protein H9767_04225 [Candidatus Nosocomiicoccus stercorigallinarum]|nr:hypothetical protein [Candidatus Nosocomiicoccus stercorigallinarum]